LAARDSPLNQGDVAMRVLTLTAFVVLLAAVDGSAALAQSCGKGMLWPYVRAPGDCLTDDEIRAGQRGVYNGPINTNPDMSGVRVETPAQSSGVTGSSGPAPQSAAPAPAAASAPPMNGAGFTPPPQRSATAAECKKGWLWPFVRGPGDCLTDAEKGNGQAGVYRAEEVVASAAPAAGPGVTQVSAAAPAASGSTGSTETASTGSAAPACRKGWLWPFVRRAGDCPTDAERGRR
jgi:hypothetical protein